MIDDTMYVCTPFSTVIALDPVTGAEEWRFDPQLKQPPTETTQHMTCRSVGYSEGGAADGQTAGGVATDAPECLRRLFVPTSDGRLIAISADTGEICRGFGGADGTVNLWANMPNITPGSAYSTSPPVITDRLVIVGGTVNDNVSTTSPSSVIRAYDVSSGELAWKLRLEKSRGDRARRRRRDLQPERPEQLERVVLRS